MAEQEEFAFGAARAGGDDVSKKTRSQPARKPARKKTPGRETSQTSAAPRAKPKSRPAALLRMATCRLL